jgi:hypothetical protein
MEPHTFLLLGYGDGTVEFRLLPSLNSAITLKSHTKEPRQVLIDTD